ncbi:hypothetical protein VCR15J2_390011 [Vibrio coralliirubri]|uniref:hypothetical protein n=1 Tax=Vibrio coralliirubri TaxID=1516159 RepID=UPI0006338D4C|nr:hypothetical protein [Vibrio coralliirubri]CDT52677.1 hypothetical protein VCR15J2_390011 [Vibrio coralliirubri]
MDYVFQKGENVILQIPLATEVELGCPLEKAFYSVYDMNSAPVIENEPVDLENVTNCGFDEEVILTIPPLDPIDMPVIKGAPRAFYRVMVEFVGETGFIHRHNVEFYLEDKLVDLEPPTNSFANYGYLMSLAGSMSSVECLMDSSFEERLPAFIQAFKEMQSVPLSIVRDRRKVALFPCFQGGEELSEKEKQELSYAQVLQANYILGGSPIEERRKSGLVSGSVGSSSNFYRGDKPLSIPLGNDALDAIKSYISWSVRLGRS